MEGDIQGLNEYVAQAMNVAVNYAPQLALPIVTLIVGLWLIKVVCTALKKAFARSHMEATLQNSIETLMSIGLKALLFISVASMVGVETTSFIAILFFTLLPFVSNAKRQEFLEDVKKTANNI